MATSASSASPIAARTASVWRRFTAVDLVTLAVFAALYRALWYLWHAVNFLFPFNQVLNAFFSILAITAGMVIVRKVGAGTMLVIAAQAINLFLQGEALVAAILYLSWGILGDIYTYFRVKGGADPFSSFKDMSISAILNSIPRALGEWFVAFPLIFLTPVSGTILAIIVPLHMLGGILGGMAGFWLGNRVKGLIG